MVSAWAASFCVEALPCVLRVLDVIIITLLPLLPLFSSPIKENVSVPLHCLPVHGGAAGTLQKYALTTLRDDDGDGDKDNADDGGE